MNELGPVWPPEPERRGQRRTSSQNWRTVVRNHAQSIVACDFLVVVTARFRTLYVFLLMEVGTRRIMHCNVTAHPMATWTLRAISGKHTPGVFGFHDSAGRETSAQNRGRVGDSLQPRAPPFEPRTRDSWTCGGIPAVARSRYTFLRPRLQGRVSRGSRRPPSRIPLGKARRVKDGKSLEELRGHCALIALQFLIPVTTGRPVPFACGETSGLG